MSQDYSTDIKPCPECGGKRVWARAGAYVILSKFTGWNIRGTATKALVCLNCGHTTFYAIDPQKLA
jgi:hypothetical protein